MTDYDYEQALRDQIAELKQEVDRLLVKVEARDAENARLRTGGGPGLDWLDHIAARNGARVVKPGQAVTADGVVCDLMPFSSFPITIDSIGADGASHRYRSLKYTLRPVAGGAQ